MRVVDVMEEAMQLVAHSATIKGQALEIGPAVAAVERPGQLLVRAAVVVRLEIGLEQVGVFGGDFDFTRMAFDYRKFWKVDEDFTI